MSGPAPDGEHLVEAMLQAVHEHVGVGHGAGVDVDAHAARPAVGHQRDIQGGADPVVVNLNRDAASALRCEHRIEVVPGATHLFEEPGALEQVADLASSWFLGHLARREFIAAPH
jgi:hypothetical protein